MLTNPDYNQRRTSLIPWRVLKQQQKKLEQSDALYELQCIEFDQELAAADDEPYIQEALRKELKQNEMFHPLYRHHLKQIRDQIKETSEHFLKRIEKLRLKSI